MSITMSLSLLLATIIVSLVCLAFLMKNIQRAYEAHLDKVVRKTLEAEFQTETRRPL